MHQKCVYAIATSVNELGDDGLQWIEVLPVAEKVRNGPKQYFTLDRDDLETLAASIRAKGDQTPLDYDHSYVERGDTRAAGWFTGDAEVRDTDDGPRLYAQVQWTPSAIDAIKAREYRFISAEWSFAEKDAKTGLWTKAKEFLAATLTNRPFFPELKPVTAADTGVVWDPETGYTYLQQELYEALNPGPPDTARYWVMDVATTLDRALVQEYGGDSRTWVVPFTRAGDPDTDGDVDVTLADSTEWVEAEQQWVTAAADRAAQHRKTRPFKPADQGVEMDSKVLAKELGLDEDATEEQLLAAVKAAKDAPPAPDGGVVLTKEQHETLTAGAAAGIAAQTELQAVKVKTKLDDAVRAGKLTPSQRPSLEALAAADFDAFEKSIDEMPEGQFRLTARGHGSDNGGADRDTDDVEVPATMVVAGSDVAVDEDSFRLDARAQKILAEAGNKRPSQDDYLAAVAQAERELAAA